MAASLGFPFTNSQWKELERQAMIYKYMVASLPVPAHLLIPLNFRNLPPDPEAAASISLLGSGGLSLKLRNGGGDLEPWRCKRTDGKKWRCSRDAAPDQKYCERHLPRGRPRSRKPVERPPNSNINLNNSTSTTTSCKKTRLVNTSICSESEFPNGKNGTGLKLVETNSLPNLQNCDFLCKPRDKVASFDLESPFGLAYKEPRGLNWMVKEDNFPVATTDQDQQWHHLASESSFAYQEEPLNLNLFGQVSSEENHQDNIFVNETPRGLIDAWSKTGNTATSLSLSSNEGRNVDNEMGQIEMGLGLIGSDEPASCLWMAACTPGGPLAEVLNLSSAISIINHSSPVAENRDCGIGPAVTTVFSPSGVLQKTLVSSSDSSGNSSPTLAGSRTNPPEIASLWLDQGRGKLASAD